MIIHTYIAIDGNQKLTKDFTLREFRSKDGEDEIKIDTELVAILQTVRDHFKQPVIVNSGYRTMQHNRKVGGVKDSNHTKGKAADIVVKGYTPLEVYEFLNEYLKNGYGLIKYPNFVHVDTRAKKYREVKTK